MDEGTRGNDEARMTNDEGMTKHESIREDHDPFADDSTQFVREGANAQPVYDLEEGIARFREAVIERISADFQRSGGGAMNNQAVIGRVFARCPHWSFVIPSSFVIRASSLNSRS
jgi:hypothetical protein